MAVVVALEHLELPADGLTVDRYAIEWDPDEATITASVMRSYRQIPGSDGFSM